MNLIKDRPHSFCLKTPTEECLIAASHYSAVHKILLSTRLWEGSSFNIHNSQYLYLVPIQIHFWEEGWSFHKKYILFIAFSKFISKQQNKYRRGWEEGNRPRRGCDEVMKGGNVSLHTHKNTPEIQSAEDQEEPAASAAARSLQRQWVRRSPAGILLRLSLRSRSTKQCLWLSVSMWLADTVLVSSLNSIFLEACLSFHWRRSQTVLLLLQTRNEDNT